MRTNRFNHNLPLSVAFSSQLRLKKGGLRGGTPQGIVGFINGGWMTVDQGDFLFATYFFSFFHILATVGSDYQCPKASKGAVGGGVASAYQVLAERLRNLVTF